MQLEKSVPSLTGSTGQSTCCATSTLKKLTKLERHSLQWSFANALMDESRTLMQYWYSPNLTVSSNSNTASLGKLRPRNGFLFSLQSVL